MVIEMKKNNLEDVNIMEGIDFKANQKRMRMRKAIEKQNKIDKRNDLIVKGILISLGIALLIVLGIWNKQLTDDALESCQNVGHSYEYCVAHL